jgi:phage terminase large subunit-like protein
MRSESDASDALGRTLPRLFTPPLVTGEQGGCPCGCALTPETSYGFDLIDFARDVCLTPFDPYQEFLSIHVGELLEDGRPRFRHVLILIARQNGKTLWAKVLTLYWLFIERVPLVLGTSTDREYARRTWQQVVEVAQDNEWLRRDVGRDSVRLRVGGETLKTLHDAEYTFAANNGRAGRSMTLHRWLCDELREHHNRDAWDSATNAMNAVYDGQVVCISNQGDDTSVVLDSLRTPAIEFIETGEGDPRLGLFEWSCPPGSEPDDVEALAYANPNMGIRGHGPDPTALVGAGRRAKRAGGEELAGFKTEVMCMRVDLLDPAIEPELWAASATDAPVDLAEHREKVALALDVSLDGSHASLVAAALIDGRVHVDVVKAWSGYGCTAELRRDLPDLVRRIRPRALGWFPNGPAAVLTADMQANKPANWPPRRVALEAIGTDAMPACMSVAELVKVGEVVHSDDPMLNAHVRSAQKLRRGDGWVFTRRNAGPVDGAYALAGAVHLARTLPPAPPPLSAA